jgi:hypothetical protein
MCLVSLYKTETRHYLMLSSTVTPTANISPLLERKIEETSAGLQKAFARHLSSISEDNAATIIEYIAAMKSEVNLSDNYRRDIIEVLCRFSRYNIISISKA